MEAPPIERHLAAVLSADVEGYSRLMHGDEDATLATLSAHRAIADELIARHRGRIANTAGDSVLAEFGSVLDAVQCAVEIQEALDWANGIELQDRRMRFRIGVNMGDVMVKGWRPVRGRGERRGPSRKPGARRRDLCVSPGP